MERMIREWGDAKDLHRIVSEGTRGPYYHQRIFATPEGRRWQVEPVRDEDVWQQFPEEEPVMLRAIREHDAERRRRERTWWFRALCRVGLAGVSR